MAEAKNNNNKILTFDHHMTTMKYVD